MHPRQVEQIQTSRITVGRSTVSTRSVHLKFHQSTFVRTEIAILVHNAQRHIRQILAVGLQHLLLCYEFDVMRFARRAYHLFRSRLTVLIISNDLDFSRFINRIVPHQPVTVLHRTSLMLALLTITLSIDKELCRRITGVNKYRHLLSFSSLPVPVRQYMQSLSLLVPHTAVQIITVFRNRSQINDTEHGTVVRPGIGIIRTRFTQIVESGPDKLSDCPFMIISTGKINIRNVRPGTIFQIIRRRLMVLIKRTRLTDCREFINPTRTYRRRCLRPQYDILRKTFIRLIVHMSPIIEARNIQQGRKSVPQYTLHLVHATGYRTCRVLTMADILQELSHLIPFRAPL